MQKLIKKNQRLAFSLIELSIVILVIGILVIGITQGSRIMSQAKLKSAQSLTTSSPVASINGLVLWLDSANENNFISGQTFDGTNITAWNDSNPQSPNKNNATRVTSNSNVTYKTSGINSLPSVYFNGTASTTTTLSGTVISSPNNNFTVFSVYKSDDVTSTTFRNIFQNGSTTTLPVSGFVFSKGGGSGGLQNKHLFTLPSIIDNAGTSTISTNPEIMTNIYNNGTFSLFVNGGTAETLTPGTGTMVAPQLGAPASIAFRIGNSENGSNPWSGLISEVIVFNRALTASERVAVEQYLSAKWGIKVS